MSRTTPYALSLQRALFCEVITMGKRFLSPCLFLLLFVSLAACHTTTEVGEYSLTLLVPVGSPQLATIQLKQKPQRYSIDYVNGPDPLVAGFLSKTYDAILAPTNLGAKLYQSGAEYVLAAVVGFGNLYLVSKATPLASMNDLFGKELIVFGQNQTGDIIVQYLLKALHLDATITYVDSVQTAQSMLVANPSKIILSAEPSLSALIANLSELSILDLQVTYQQVSGKLSYPQVGLFVKKTVDRNAISQLLSDFEASITWVNQEPAIAAEAAVGFGFSFSKTVMESAIPRSHLQFVLAHTMISDMEEYFNLIVTTNPNLLNLPLPDSHFYFIP